MSRARVVYDGVGGGGDLFAGKKFFLMQRIPSRDRYKNLIKSNGGAIVLVESQADFIIADHALANQPAGSISWRWVEASVNKGELADIEDHRAGPTTKPTREAGSGSTLPTKKSRTAFTEEDDRLLMEWCTRAERKGLSLAGNVIFQDLEEKNNRHTFQSWRDRWLKHLAHRPRPQLPGNEDEEDEDEDEDEEGPADDGPQARSSKRRTVSRTVPSRPKSPTASSKSKTTVKPSAPKVASARPPPVSSSTTRLSGDVFTDDETQELMDLYDDIMNISEDKIIDAWMSWAEEHPEHTAQQWRNYFSEYVVPKMKKGKGKAKDKIAERPRKMPPPKQKPLAQSASKASSIKHAKTEIEDSQEIPSSSPPSKAEGLTLASTKDESLFKEHLLELAGNLGVHVNLKPLVCGRPISLFKLWQIVESDEFGGVDEVDGKQLWPKVATRMNFPKDRQVLLQAGKELQDVFNEILADLEELTKRIIEESDTSETEEQALLEAQLQLSAANGNQHQNGNKELNKIEQDEEQGHDDDLDYPQFSPRLPKDSGSGKRSSDSDREKEKLPSNKRQRIDKGKGKEREIPSTPEDGMNTTHDFLQSHQPTPKHLKSSPLKKSWVQDEQAISEEDGDVAFASPSTRPWPKPKKTPPKRNLEPETQDFHFSIPDPEPGDINDDLSSSPSLPPLNVALAQRRAQAQISQAATRGSVHSSSAKEGDSSTQSQTDAEKHDALVAFIDESVSLGYPQDIVVEALVVTTLEIGPHARRVMESMMGDDPIPDDEAGVWTAKDDEALNLRRESKEYRRIVTKHGLRRVKLRREYLAEQESLLAETDEG